MTEEFKQKAIEFVRENYCKKCMIFDDFDDKECGGEIGTCAHYKDYIAGATENGIQWHKISEELPKAEIGIHNVETYRVLKLNAYKNPVECYCSYNNITQKFETVVDTKKSVYWKEIKGVVAWQEIPLVPEEVKAWLYPTV